MVCKEYPYGLIYKKNFKFLGRTVSEKSAMLISSYHRICSMAVLVSYVQEINELLGTRYFELYENEQQKKKNHELLYKM